MLIDEFLHYLQYEKNYSPHTVLSYRIDLYQFCEFISTQPDTIVPASVTSIQIQQWILSLMSNHISSSTLSRKISTLKSFWRFLLRCKHVKNNPTLKILLPKTKKPLPAFFKESEMSNVTDVSFLADSFESVRNHLIIVFFYHTGVRLSELIGIKDTDVDVERGVIQVIGKRNKQRAIPISPLLIEHIKQYRLIRDANIENQEGNLFILSNGKRLYAKLVYTIVHDTMAQVSNLHKLSPHVLRHTFATCLLNGGAEINAVKELLGHTSLAATQVYTHTSFEELCNIYNHAHPRVK
jgi:integrase/recombinase XerC